MSVTQIVQTVGGLTRPLTERDVRGLSGLRLIDRRDFLDAWVKLSPQRRITVVREMIELAEEHVKLDFSEVWTWLLEDTDPVMRASAIEGLWENTSSRTMRRMLALLRDDQSQDVRAAAASGLSTFAYMAAVDELDEGGETLEQFLGEIALNEREPLEVRRRALESAGYFGENDAVQQQIERAYQSEEQLLRESALVAMGRSMLPRWLPAISKGLSEASPALRYEASRAAGEMAEKAQPLLPKLAPLLNDNDTEVALSAIWALGQIGGQAAERVLNQTSKSQDEARSQAAIEALEELRMGETLI